MCLVTAKKLFVLSTSAQYLKYFVNIINCYGSTLIKKKPQRLKTLLIHIYIHTHLYKVRMLIPVSFHFLASLLFFGFFLFVCMFFSFKENYSFFSQYTKTIGHKCNIKNYCKRETEWNCHLGENIKPAMCSPKPDL